MFLKTNRLSVSQFDVISFFVVSILAAFSKGNTVSREKLSFTVPPSPFFLEKKQVTSHGKVLCLVCRLTFEKLLH